MAFEPTPWPAQVEGSPAVAVIEQAISRKRLSHSLLISGDNLQTLEWVALSIADRLLNPPGSAARFAPAQHPDCFFLRPTKRSRQIGADETRDLIGKVQVSPAVSQEKVGIVLECDRMNQAASNIFLKTLEEPPARTTLILVTEKPYSLLPTIRSRVLSFRFPEGDAKLPVDGWDAWLGDYREWLGRLPGLADKKAAGEIIVIAYGLIARFDALLTFAAAAEWKRIKATLPTELSADEEEAMEVGITNGFKHRLFASIETATREFALPFLKSEDPLLVRAYTGSIARLERATGLLKVNLNESAALEDFLLGSMRLWAGR
ncbi:DNA polymerase III subunit gamma/tau [Nibricoccus sp. IMCC34717]|uniref:DNA polymerase III subunit gamma/tau n=1 Tax=Nibricoccus sp. IMCC34717 TaxID=3034021 RepID=UPI00384EAC29